MISHTPKPPYYAVIFTSLLKENPEGYEMMAKYIFELAKDQEGFLGIESARSEIGISVSYWSNLESIQKWKENTAHQHAKEAGKSRWYEHYKTRIAKVEKEY